MKVVISIVGIRMIIVLVVRFGWIKNLMCYIMIRIVVVIGIVLISNVRVIVCLLLVKVDEYSLIKVILNRLNKV